MLATVLATALTAGVEAGDTQSLVKQLGSSHYPTREKATQALRGKTDTNTTQLLLQAMKSGDQEARRRAESLLEPYLAEERKRAIEEKIQKIREACGPAGLPWCDMAQMGWENQQVYMQQAKGDCNSPVWSKYRNATEFLLRDILTNGYDVSELLDRMKERENAWVQDYNRYAHSKLPISYPINHDK